MATKIPDPLTRELSSFFKTAAEAFDEVKETVLKGGQATRATVDVQLLKRSRERALARLGEVVLDELKRGASIPVACDALVKEIRDLDAELAKSRADADRLWKSDKAPGGPAPSPDDDEDE